MGTSYTMSGSIEIHPPLNYSEIKKAREVAVGLLAKHHAAQFERAGGDPQGVFSDFFPLSLHVESTERETEEGHLTIKTAAVVIPSHSHDASLFYDMRPFMAALVAALPGHQWNGEVIALREDGMFAYKLVAEGQRIRQTEGAAYIRWEDGSDEDMVSDLI